jgi:tetratricopeptide (TPR) repeat protein
MFLRATVPLVTGCILLCSSVLSWLDDPLDGAYTAWKMPVDMAWGFHTTLINYGLLCTVCALLAFVIARAQWQMSIPILMLLCIVPVVLFVWQFLFADLYGINLVAQHTIQFMLLQQRIGYATAAKLIGMDVLNLSTESIQSRAVLLLDQVSIGPILLVGCCLGLIGFRALYRGPRDGRGRRFRPLLFVGLCAALLIAMVGLGRSLAANVCNYEAKAALSLGDYASALKWLDDARFLDPAFDNLAYYHRERGQALYGLHPTELGDEMRVYLASVYREQGDPFDAYQELLASWHSRPSLWVNEEMGLALERLSQYTQQKNAPPIQRASNDVSALPWLQLLAQLDDTNVYAQYVVGSIDYEQNNYGTVITQMLQVVHLNHNGDVQSSAYTYMALSLLDRGDIVNARKLLAVAIRLDPYYHNNTAREALSGLH